MDWKLLVTSSVVAAFIAFVMNAYLRWQEKSDKSRALLRGILFEIDHAQECGEAYVQEAADRPIWSPAYRVDSDFMREGLPSLAEHRALRESESRDVHQLLIYANEVNRCLDQIAALTPRIHEDETAKRATRETGRARSKFKRILEQVPLARKAVKQALERLAWFERSD